MQIPPQNFHAKIMETTVSGNDSCFGLRCTVSLQFYLSDMCFQAFFFLSFQGSSSTRGRSESRGIKYFLLCFLLHLTPKCFDFFFFFVIIKLGFFGPMCDFFQRVKSEPDYRVPPPLPEDVRH